MRLKKGFTRKTIRVSTSVEATQKQTPLKAPRGASRRLEFSAGVSVEADSIAESAPPRTSEFQGQISESCLPESWPSPPVLRRSSATPITSTPGSVVTWTRLNNVTAYTSSCALASHDVCERILSSVRDVR